MNRKSRWQDIHEEEEPGSQSVEEELSEEGDQLLEELLDIKEELIRMQKLLGELLEICRKSSGSPMNSVPLS